MNLVIYLIVAAVVGWVATDPMQYHSNLLINFVVAVVGAFLGDFFSRLIFFQDGMFKAAITVPTMLSILLGSMTLMAFVSLFIWKKAAPQSSILPGR